VSPDPTFETGAPDPGASSAGATANEEERARAAYEAELSRISSADMILQAAVSLLNIGARRLAPAGDDAAAGPGRPGESQAEAGTGGTGATGERDLEQVRDAIDAVRALLEILERRVPEGLRPLRDALAQLQIAYAREVEAAGAGDQAARQPAQSGADPASGRPAAKEGQAGKSAPEDEGERRGPGPAESSGRLWVPGR
jgi:hypothetical protein